RGWPPVCPIGAPIRAGADARGKTAPPWFRFGAPRARPQRFAPVARVLEPSPHWSGRGFGPRRSSGTLQLSTRCSSLALPPSRSLAVRFGSTLLASPRARGLAPGTADATMSRNVHATTRTAALDIPRGDLTI